MRTMQIKLTEFIFAHSEGEISMGNETLEKMAKPSEEEKT